MADPIFKVTRPVDVMIGGEEYGNIIQDDIYKIDDGMLDQNTKLGCTLQGNVKLLKTKN